MRAASDELRLTPADTVVRYQVVVWFCLAAAFAYIARNSISVAESTIRKDLNLTKDDMSMVMTVFFLFYVLGQLPGGWLGDRWGTRRALTAFSFVWSLATAAMGFASGLPLLLTARAVNGAAQAGLFPCCANSISKWFPKSERGRANGPLGAFMSVGGAIGAAVTGWMLEDWGFDWRSVFFWSSLLGVVWGVGFFWWFRDLPQQHSGVSPSELAWIQSDLDSQAQTASGAREPTPWSSVLTSPAMWWICGQQFFRAAASMFFFTWFPTFLQESRHVSIGGSGVYTACPLIAVVIGNLVGGVVSDRIYARTGSRRWARQRFSVFGLVLCALLVWVSYFIANVDAFMAVISIATFWFAIGSPCSYTIVIDMGGRHVATAFGMMNLAGNVGAMLFPLLLPRFQTAFGWDAVILIFGAMYLAAAGFWLLLNPDGDIFEQSLIPSKGPGPHDSR